MLTTQPCGKATRRGLAAVTDVDSEPQPGHLAVANAALSGESSDRLHNVHTAPADLSCAELAHRLENAPRLERLAGEAALIHGKRVVGLTHAELKVILALLQGQTIGEQAQRLGLSQKTLYTQRLAGVKKLVECHPHLAPAFRARCCRVTRKRTDGV